jgi:hypothetical protein
MESPFVNNTQTNTFVMYLEPMLNKYYKTYQNVITLSNLPQGPLQEYVHKMNPPKLSEFQNTSPLPNKGFECLYVLQRYSNKQNAFSMDNIMNEDDIPSIFSFLTNNGYIINTQFTDMLQKSEVNLGGSTKKRKMICIINYNV